MQLNDTNIFIRDNLQNIIDGKFDKEVDFDLEQADVSIDNYNLAKYNIDYIDSIVTKYLNDDLRYSYG